MLAVFDWLSHTLHVRVSKLQLRDWGPFSVILESLYLVIITLSFSNSKVKLPARPTQDYAANQRRYISFSLKKRAISNNMIDSPLRSIAISKPRCYLNRSCLLFWRAEETNKTKFSCWCTLYELISASLFRRKALICFRLCSFLMIVILPRDASLLPRGENNLFLLQLLRQVQYNDFNLWLRSILVAWMLRL